MIVHSRFLYVLLLRTYCYLLTSLFLLRHLTYTAAAVKCLQNAEKRKFTRLGGGTVTADTITREEVLRTLQASNDLLQIWANCPHGSMGPIMHRFFLNDHSHYPIQFSPTHPEAANMSRLSSLHPGLTGCDMWKRARQPHEKFNGHAYTAPTHSSFFLQQFGLACTKAFAIHHRRKPSNVARPQPSILLILTQV
jgi:hypothetical protein